MPKRRRETENKMEIKVEGIDGGKAFDWGRTSADYAKFRDIYPEKFYEKVLSLGLCGKGQRVLDLGTGTGVVPRNMKRFGAEWTGTDISENQIEQAKRLSEGMGIEYFAMPAEKLSFPDGSFDVITACQCFWYFDHETLAPKLYKMLKSGGSYVMMSMEWLPFEDDIARASEELVLKYSPDWNGAGETIHPIYVPDCYREYFDVVYSDEYYLDVPFTRESWNGRMKACRGVGASLTPEKISAWEKEHTALLEKIAPEAFTIRHFGAIVQLKKITR